jgi:serine phosphatase RsbU (regulator of sigma subunit)
VAIVIAQELLVLRAIKRALRDHEDVPPTIWAVNVLIESQLPTFLLLILLAGGWLSPYEVLVAPAMLIYFLFIILSTLRLSPGITLLTGLLSGMGYLVVALYVDEKFGAARGSLGGFPLRFYVIYALGILVAGVIAAAVAQQVRGYVWAALREAELQGRLDQVQHDLDVARSIQQGLLPSSAPKLDNFELAGWNQPADQTGGDYFDWQSLPDGRVAISLGDATGHGIGPALVSTSCRAYLRASVLAGTENNGLLDRLNRLLADDLSANRFVTFAAIFLDPPTAHVKILSAGHGPILWYRHDADQIESLEAQGIPLGMISGIEYSQAIEGRLAPGDMLIVVTDGFYEWENPDGQEFGLQRLEAVVRECRDCGAEEMISRLRSAVERFCGGTEQKDDLTAVVLRRKSVVNG